MNPRILTAALALACLTPAAAGPAPAGPPAAPKVSQAEQQATHALVGDVRNPLTLQDPAPAGAAYAPCFVGGSVHGTAGAPPHASAPTDGGGAYLVRSAFGQPVGTGAPFAGFQAAAVDRAERLLYYDRADDIDIGDDDPGSGRYARDRAAFRYKDLMYGKIAVGACESEPERECSDASDCTSPDACVATDYVVNLLEARLGDGQRTMEDFYGTAERERSRDAERALRDALKYAPQDRNLRRGLLDVYYDRVVAELAFAKAARVEAIRRRIVDPAAGGATVLDEEIAAFEAALGTDDQPGGFRFALSGYFELLNDPLGVDVATWDPQAEDQGYGFWLLKQELPERAQRAATYLEGGVRTPVTPANAQPGDAPMVLFDGYKDLVLVFDALGEYADTSAELALRYLTRLGPGDEDAALALIGESQQKLYVEGQILLGLLDTEPAALPAQTGLSAAVGQWQQALGRLAGMRDVEAGRTNLLGFDRDFLMLIVTDDPGETTFDAFLAQTQNGLNGTIDLALAKYDAARGTYDAYRGNEDQLALEFEQIDSDYALEIFDIVGTADPSAPEYRTPFDNEGSLIQLQQQSIEIARTRIERNTVRMSNVREQIAIEIDRVGKELGIKNLMSRVVLRYGSEQAALTERIAEIEAEQQIIEGATQGYGDLMGGIANAVVLGPVGLIAGIGQAFASVANGVLQADAERRKGDLEGQKEKKAAEERAELNDLEGDIISINSKALVKNLVLQMHEIAVDSREAALVLAQEGSRLRALFDRWAELERRRERAAAGLAGRYFADPLHRIRQEVALVRADRFFADAQRWVFFLARALEYKWNIRLDELPGGGIAWPAAGGERYSVDSIFLARNASELANIVAALRSYDLDTQSIVKEDRFSWFSFRDDFFNLNGDEAAFRAELEARMSTDPSGRLVIDFSTAQNLSPSFPLYSRDNWNDKIVNVSVNVPGLTEPLTATLSYGGTSFIRTQLPGAQDPAQPDRVAGEERVYATRYWFKDVFLNKWAYTDNQKATVQLLPNAASQQIPPGVAEVDDFQERSVAATGWRLQFPQGPDVSTWRDIELRVAHRSATRQTAKAAGAGTTADGHVADPDSEN